MRYRRGGYFGEVSLLTGDPRGATVRASGPVRAAFLDWQAFLELPERTRQAATGTDAFCARRRVPG